jgi:glycosyltransferase involved in cell wall biosynthesis
MHNPHNFRVPPELIFQTNCGDWMCVETFMKAIEARTLQLACNPFGPFVWSVESPPYTRLEWRNWPILRDALMKLSVMMITYNHEQFISQALNSILAQRVNFDYEIVVGEDCSTDGTRKVLMDFHLRYPQRIVPLLRDKNIGALQNMGATLAACRGIYIALLEGDDYWTDLYKLQKQADFLDRNPTSAMCCHRVQLLDPTGQERVDVYPVRAAGAYTIEDLLSENFVPACSAMVRRELIGALPSWHSKLAMGDWPLFALVSSHGKIELMDEVMAVYRVHSGGIWSSRSSSSRLREISRMLQVLDEHFDFKYTNTIRRTLAQYYLDLALLERQSGNRMDTGKYLMFCLRNGGFRFPNRILGGLAAYALIGSWYKLFSRASSMGV